MKEKGQPDPELPRCWRSSRVSSVHPLPPGKALAPTMALLKSPLAILPAEIGAIPCWPTQPKVGVQVLAAEATAKPTPSQLGSLLPPPQFHLLLTTPMGLTTGQHCWSTICPYLPRNGAMPTSPAPAQVVRSLPSAVNVLYGMFKHPELAVRMYC